MPRRLFAALAVTLPLLASGCTDTPNSTPTAPPEGLSAAVGGSALSCSFSNVGSLIRDEFLDATQKQAASNDLQAMRQAGQRTSGAKTAGFDIMGLIASAKHRDLAASATIGSNLTNQLILCMFTPTTDFDATSFPFDFVVSLDRAQLGGYEIRKATDANATPVLSFGSPRLSSIAPASGNWSGVLSETVLIYGRPVLVGEGPAINHEAYEWSTFRPGATFNYPPGVEVGLCDLPAVPEGTNLVTESDVGLLGLVVEPANCDPLLAPFPTSSLNRGWRPFDLVRSLGRWGAGLISPEPLHASTLLLTKTIGGVGGGKSIYSLGDVTSPITFAFVTQPTDTRVGVPIKPPVQVQALFGTEGVGGVTFTVGGVSNNGTPTEVRCPNSPCTAKTAPGGIATIDNLTSTKSGALVLVITDASMPGTSTIPFTTGQASNKINVRPAR